MNTYDFSNLTKREFEVLNLVIKGFSNEIIARELSISVHTVKTYLENIFRKFSVHNRVQAAVYAVIYGAAYFNPPASNNEVNCSSENFE